MADAKKIDLSKSTNEQLSNRLFKYGSRQKTDKFIKLIQRIHDHNQNIEKAKQTNSATNSQPIDLNEIINRNIKVKYGADTIVCKIIKEKNLKAMKTLIKYKVSVDFLCQ